MRSKVVIAVQGSYCFLILRNGASWDFPVSVVVSTDTGVSVLDTLENPSSHRFGELERNYYLGPQSLPQNAITTCRAR